MNIKEFIASGILEKYVLGLASEEEQREVERVSSLHAEVKEEIEAIEIAMEKYLSLQKIPVPGELQQAVLEKINSPGSSVGSAQADTSVSSVSPRSGFTWMSAVLITAVLLSLLGSFFLYQNNLELDDDLQAVRAQLLSLERDCDALRAQNQQLSQKVEILQNIDNQTIYLNGTDKAPQAVVAVYWNQGNQKSYLNTINLPTPPTDKQYQLWAIVDGQPVDMGVFDPVDDRTALQEVPFIDNPQAFAITLEPRGGNPAPTLEEMVAIGNVS